MDKLLFIVLMFDDDGELDMWVFVERVVYLLEIFLNNINGYLIKECGGWRKWDIGGINNELCVM